MMNKTLYILLFTLLACFNAKAQEKIILLNEGNWQADNGRMTYFEDGVIVSNQWFREKNGYKLGDTPNDIIQISDNLIAIAINWSNIIQFITPEGIAVAATEDVPNNRKLASDGEYVYVSSYGHECNTVNGMNYFEKGFVAKIDVKSFQVVSTVEVGYEPEGIAYYNGYLFVANTGGYAFQEPHDYETTVSIIDANTMQLVKNVDTGIINLYGKMSQSGKYLCINSPGDYYDVMPNAIIFDCEKALANESPCFQVLPYAATYNTTTIDGNFYAIGSKYSYYTGEYSFNYVTIDPEKVMQTNGKDGVKDELPGTVKEDIKKMAMPYGIYVNPYTGYIYATDAASFAEAGKLYQWDPDGQFLCENKVYINTAHFLALPPDGRFTGITEAATGKDLTGHSIYDLQGREVKTPQNGGLYIQNGKKFIKK